MVTKHYTGKDPKIILDYTYTIKPNSFNNLKKKYMQIVPLI